MSGREELKLKGGSSDFSDEETSQKYVHEQTEFFDNMKQFLLSQQTLLRQNLENVKIKLEKPTFSRKRGSGRFQVKEISRPSTAPGSHNNESVLRGPSSSTSTQSKQKDEIQICPVCGLEFEAGAPDLLEDHVAGHWCSSETE